MTQKDEPLISIVVPVYNVEKYLAECVDSILAQTYPCFELILVDDGSPDACGSICDSYREKDSRVRVIHKENGGLSDARNHGIDAAKGEYITFIDSDDIVSKDYLQYLLDAMLKHNADIVQGNIFTSIEKLNQEGTDRHNQPYHERVFENRESIRDYLVYRTHYSNSTVKLYRLSLFDGIRFPLGKYSEDEYTTFRLVLKSKKDVCLSKVIYFYRLHNGSNVHTFKKNRFEACYEVPAQIREALHKSGYTFDAEANYKEMRLILKIYNDFIQGGQYDAFKGDLDALQAKLKKIPIDQKVWDQKYKIMKTMLCTAPWLYRLVVAKGRAKLRG